MSAKSLLLRGLVRSQVGFQAAYLGAQYVTVCLCNEALATETQHQQSILPEQVIINLDETGTSPSVRLDAEAGATGRSRPSELFGNISAPALKSQDLFEVTGQEKLTSDKETAEFFLTKQRISSSLDTRSAVSHSIALRFEPAADPIKSPIFLKGKPLRRFRVYLSESDLTLLLTSQDAFRLFPPTFVGVISIDQGLLSGSNDFKDFYPAVHIEPCDLATCFENISTASRPQLGFTVSGSSSGERSANGQFGMRTLGTSIDRLNIAQSEVEFRVPQLELLNTLWSADMTSSVGRTRVRDDNNTLLNTSDDRIVDLGNIGYNRKSLLHSSSYFIPSIATKSQIILVNSELKEGLGQHEISAPPSKAYESYSDQEMRNPTAFKSLQMGQIKLSHLDSSMGGRINFYISGFGTRTYIPRSVYEPGNPRTLGEGQSLQYGLELRSPLNPFAAGSTTQLKNQQYLVGVSLADSSAENRSSTGAASSKRQAVKIQTVRAHGALGIDLWRYRLHKVSVGLFNTAGSENTRYFAECNGVLEPLCSKSTDLSSALAPQWGSNLNLIHSSYHLQLLAQMQSRNPDAIERFGNYSGVKPNPSLLDEKQKTLGASLTSHRVKIEYLHSREENTIVPETGTGSTSPFIVFVNQEPSLSHQFSVALGQSFAEKFELKGQYVFNRSFPVAHPSLVTPRTPKHTLTAETSTKRIRLLDLGNNQLQWFSGLKTSWQSKYFLDTKNLIEFQPKILFKPWAGLVIRSKYMASDQVFSVLSCTFQADFSYPEEATQTDTLGNSYTVYHSGIEGNPATSTVYNVTLRGEF